MKVSQREIVMAIVAGGVILLGGTAILGKPKIERWKEVRRDQALVLADIAVAEGLVAEHDDWEKRYQELRRQLHQLPEGEKVERYFQSRMNAKAVANGVRIVKQQSTKEQAYGDVYELAIECRDWEGSLDSLIHFLFALENDGAMFDVRSLWVKPKSKSLLKGNFKLYCAYTRAEEP